MLRIVGTLLLSLLTLSVFSQPSGYSNVVHTSDYPGQALGITFDDNGLGYVWEKAGRVWIVQSNGTKSATPLIDISEEVGNWRDFGLVGFALDPSFLSNGHIYLFYVVDRHHFLNFGTPAYYSNADEYYNAAIGRITRYTATAGSGYTTVDYNSRLVLLGESIDTGIPILHQSHGVGTMLFGEDETLLVSCGDGASYFGTDVGGAAHGTFTAQALVDGIISSNEDVGAFRSQSLHSLNGKVLRLDKATGNGLPSNPWYDASEPRSPRSRTWTVGLRNPARMTLKPGTGTPNPADGNPGTLMVGDVGWESWEELNIVRFGGMNFGWPIYEGVGLHPTYDPLNIANLDAPTPGGCGQSYYTFEDLLKPWNGSTPSFPDPCGGGNIDGSSYDLMTYYGPAVTWQHSALESYATLSDGSSVAVGSGPTKGSQFSGNASIGGTWYQGSQYGADYENLYFHADYGQRWIRVFSFDNDMVLDSVGEFDNSVVGRPVGMFSHPTQDEVYYIRLGNEVRKYSYSPSGNQVPTALAASDVYYSAANSLSVNFDGSGSTDPESAALTYEWNFGDGSPTSSAESPTHVYSVVGASPATYTVTLTVTDPGGLSDVSTMHIFLNNTPPVISSTSLDGVNTYSVLIPETLPMNAVVTDAEHALGTLDFVWQVALHHDNHTHPEPIDNNQSTSTLISPIGCDGPTYFYRVELTVTDPEGLSTEMFKDIYPLCSPLVTDDIVEYTLSETIEIDVLANDVSSDALDYGSFVFKSLPANGIATFDAINKTVSYVQDGSAVASDQFVYQISDVDGDTSARATVNLNWVGPPQITILSPANGATIDNKVVRLTYSITGDETLVNGVEFQLNSDPVKQDFTMSGSYTFFDLTLGADEIKARLLDGSNSVLSFPESKDTTNFTAAVVGADIKLLTGIANNVESATWKTITLDSTYTSMVVVATVMVENAAIKPAITRVRNASGNSFELKVQNPSGTAISGYKVHYMVVEEGTYTVATDGIKMEAQKYLSERTASSANWNANKEIQAYVNSYVSPVAMGQVMTDNDADWSVAWISSQYVDVPANDQKIFTGKHVGEDPDNTRADETIGFIVIDAGSYIVRGRPFSAGVGYEGILGVDDNSSGYEYSLNNMIAPQYGILSSAGMNDSDGGWPVLIGVSPLSPASFTIAIDEDQIADTERSHAAEQVAYFVFDSLFTEATISFPVEWVDFTATPEDDQVRLEWSTAVESNNDFFTIERSKDGFLFGQVLNHPAVGNSQTVQSYQAYDAEPLTGRSFYRMKQTDFDGAFSYSQVVEVYFDGVNVKVYPNPIRQGEELFMELFLGDTRNVDLKLINTAGQTIQQKRYAFDRPENQISLSMADLPPGTYFVYLIADQKRFVKKILVSPR